MPLLYVARNGRLYHNYHDFIVKGLYVSLGRRNQSNHSVKYSVTFWCTDLTQCVVSLKPRGFSGCVNRKCTKWFRFLTLLVAPISGHYFNHTVHFA